MKDKLATYLHKLIKDKARRRRRGALLGAVALAVALFTTAALMRPASTAGKTAYCGVEEHEHTQACYHEERVLRCDSAEADHVHTEACYTVLRETVCEKEVHVHTLQCFSDPAADVETEADWAAAAADAELTGRYAADLLAVAKTQLGYHASSDNYLVDEAGAPHGYTRYGAWAGSPYMEWDAAFVSFCLTYARIPEAEAPRGTEPEKLAAAWRQSGLWRSPADYAPRPGDLAFLDNDGDGAADAAALVAEADADAETVRLLGRDGAAVGYRHFSAADGALLGWAELPGHDEAEAQPVPAPAAPAPAERHATNAQLSAYSLTWNSGSGTSTVTGNTMHTKPAANAYYPDDRQFWSQVVATLRFSLSDGSSAEPNSMEIRLPAHIFKDRQGNPTDEVNLPLPAYPNTAVNPNFPFNYEVVGGEVVLRNYGELMAGTDYLCDIAYKYLPTMVANGYTDQSLRAILGLQRAGGLQTVQTGALKVEVETFAEYDGLIKKALYTSANNWVENRDPANSSPSTYINTRLMHSWPAELGDAPADAADYFYIGWTVNADTSVDVRDSRYIYTTQPYELVITNERADGGQIIAYRRSSGLRVGSRGVPNDETSKTTFVDGHSVDGVVLAALYPDGSRLNYSGYGGSYKRESGEGYIWVRYPKTLLDNAAGTFRAKNTVTVELRTADGTVQRRTASAEFDVSKPSYPGDDLPLRKIGRESFYGSRLLRDGKPANINYRISEDNMVNAHWNISNEGTRPVTYTFHENGKLTIRPNSATAVPVELSAAADDFTYDSVMISGLVGYAANFTDTISYRRMTLEEYEAEPFRMDIYAKIRGAADFQLAGYALTIGGTAYFDAQGQKLPNNIVPLPANTVEVKAVTTNAYFGHYIAMDMNITVKPTARVRAAIPADFSEDVYIDNTVTETAVAENQTIRAESTDDAVLRDGHGTYGLTKYVNQNVNYDHAAGLARLEYDLEFQYDEYVGTSQYAAQYNNSIQSYLLCDLLPHGMYADTSSVRGDNVFQVENVYVLNNWRGSGRQMLLIRAYLNETVRNNIYGRRHIKFYAYYDYRYAEDRVVTLDNSAAIIPLNKPWDNATNTHHIYPDNGAGLTNGDAVWFVDVDGDDVTDGETVAYDRAMMEISILLRDQVGLAKTVRGSKDSGYSTEGHTGVASEYSYELLFTNAEYVASTGVVVFDTLETAHGANPHWNGVFKGITLSNLVGKGINPTVYYSTHAAMKTADLTTQSALTNLNNATYWTRTLPADKSKITAIAVDMGSYTFTSLEKAWFTVEMTAPGNAAAYLDDPATAPDESVLAYNKAYVKTGSAGAVTATDTVTVALENPDVKIHKTSEPASGTQDDPAEVQRGDTIWYDLAITNNEAVRLTNIVVRDPMNGNLGGAAAQQVYYVGNPNATVSIPGGRLTRTTSGNTYTFTISHLDPGETLHIRFPGTVKNGVADNTVIPNTAEITGVSNTVLKEPIRSETTWHIVRTLTDLSFSKTTVSSAAAAADRYFPVHVYLNEGTAANVVGKTLNVSARGSYSSNPSTVTVRQNGDTDHTVLYIKHGETITIDGVPYGVTYRLEESVTSDLVVHYRDDQGNETNTGTVDRPNPAVALTNYWSSNGTLSFTKTVTGEGAVQEKYFTVRVKLAAPHFSGRNITVNPRGSGNSSSSIYLYSTEREYVFKIKHGETITLNNVPWGTVYSIVEDDHAGYTATYRNHAGEARNSGVLASAAERVDITNAYAPPPDAGDLTVKKVAIPASTSNYTVYLTLTDSTGVHTGKKLDMIKPDGTLQEITVGQRATLVIQNGQQYKVKDIPYGVAYEIRENTSSRYIARYINENDGTESGSGVISMPSHSVRVENYTGLGRLEVKKTVTGLGVTDWDRYFNITVQINLPASGRSGTIGISGGSHASNPRSLRYNTTQNGASYTIPLKLKHDETITLTDLPAGAIWEVWEENYTAEGFTTTYRDDSAGQESGSYPRGIVVSGETGFAQVVNTSTNAPLVGIHKEAEPGTSYLESAPTPVDVGGTIWYDLAITNNDVARVSNIVVRDPMNGNLSGAVNNHKYYIGDPNATVSIPGGRLTRTNSVNTYTFTISHLDPGETLHILFPGTVKNGTAAGTLIPNTAEIISMAGKPVSIHSETTYHRVELPRVELHKTSDPASGTQAAPAPVRPGDSILYMLRVVNLSNTEVRRYIVEDEIPAWLTPDKTALQFSYAATPNSKYAIPRTNWFSDPVWDGNKLTLEGLNLRAADSGSNGRDLIIYVPCTVKDDTPPGTVMDNTAYLTSLNGTAANISSETTWHKTPENVTVHLFKEVHSGGSQNPLYYLDSLPLFTVKYQINGGAEQTATIPANGKSTIEVPYGASLRLWEEVSAPWMQYYMAHQPTKDHPEKFEWLDEGTVYVDRPYTCQLASVTEDTSICLGNAMEVVGLDIKKFVTDEVGTHGNAIDDDTLFRFRVSFRDTEGNPWFWTAEGLAFYAPQFVVFDDSFNEAGNVTLDVTNKRLEFSLRSRYYVSIPDIPQGYTAVVEELNVAGDWQTVYYSATTWAVIASGSSAEFTVEADMGISEIRSKRVTVANTPLGRSLTVSKNLVGATAAQSDEEFSFRLTVKNPDGTAFDATTLTLPAGVKGTASGDITFKLKHGESVTIDKLPKDAKVTLQELNHDGYNVYMKEGAVDLAVGDSSGELTLSENREITVYNAAGAPLPETGGAGSGMIYASGVLLMMTGLAILLAARRPRADEEPV